MACNGVQCVEQVGLVVHAIEEKGDESTTQGELDEGQYLFLHRSGTFHDVVERLLEWNVCLPTYGILNALRT